MRAAARGLLLAAAALLAACGGGDAGDEAAAACSSPSGPTADNLLECVTLAGVQAHLDALAAIAQAHGGSREAGTRGYDAAGAYVADTLRAAGYAVTVQPFQIRSFQSLSASVLAEVAPAARPIAHQTLRYSGSGDVTAPVAAAAGNGCTAADFAGFVGGRIALVRRGECAFETKALLAHQAGAVGVIIANDIEGDLQGLLSADFALELPVVGIARAEGERLRALASQGLVLRLKTATRRVRSASFNVIAETAAGDPGHVVVLGAHLDTVAGVEGANDNGSGVAALLETAVQMAALPVRNRLRFAFWGAEEIGLLGSAHYLQSLEQAQRDRIALYLNFDMLAAPNFAFAFYAGDGEPPPGTRPRPRAGPAIEQALAGYYLARGLPTRRSDIGDRSDHRSFARHGIPFGGIESGHENVKRAGEVPLWGGSAGVAHDPCYHRGCDARANLGDFALQVNADAVAWLALHFAGHRLPR